VAKKLVSVDEAVKAPADDDIAQRKSGQWVARTIAQLKTDLAISSGGTPNTQTGTTYTLALTDDGRPVEMNNAAANVVTIPPNTVPFPIGAVVEVCQLGAGQTTIVNGAGVVLRAPGNRLKLTAQYSTASLRKRAINEWVVAGDLST
jgi:hypothetical protein